MGRAYALFLAGAGVANLVSGFLASAFDYQFTYFASIVPCLLNLLVIASIKEPTFHKVEQKEKIFTQLGLSFKSIVDIPLLRGLTIIMTTLTFVELFKVDFGQIYILRYVSSPEVLGILWAAFAFAWALGSAVAHRMRGHLNLLVLATILPLVLMSLVDNGWALALFMLQAVAAAALINQIETKVQEATPSAVRASILSVLSSLGRAVAVPASIALGWIIHAYNVLWALYMITFIGVGILLYWLWLAGKTRLASSSPK